MDLIDKNKDNIKEGDYEKMCSILKYLHIKDITDTYQLFKIKTKIVIIENPRIL